jgi:hypothetical protein
MPAILLSLLFNRYVMGGLLILTIIGGIYYKGKMDAAAAQREAGLRVEIAILQRDRDIAKAAEKLASERAEEIASDAAEREKEIAAYAEELKSRPDRCDLTPADLERLRAQGGKSKQR